MNKAQSLARGEISLVLIGLFLGSVYFSSAFAFSSGVTGQSCTNCHTSGSTTVSITGPDVIQAHSGSQYTLTITGDGPGGTTPEVIGGLNVAATDGILALVDAATRLENGEITHTQPKAFTGNTVSWLFEWAPPVDAVAGDSFVLSGQGVNANDMAGSGGDFVGTTTFNVQFVPIPAVAWLFPAGLIAGLGWMRRRSA